MYVESASVLGSKATHMVGATRIVSSPGKPVVFIVDDDISVRESLRPMIAQAGWQPEVFASATEFLDHRGELTPGCLVLDVSLPDLDGLEVQKRIADRTELPIVFITGYGDIPMTVRAMRAGAVEFLTKPFVPEALLSAVRGAIERSRAVLDAQLAVRGLRARFELLTPRERQVMELVVDGRLNKEVGGELGISEITVKAHRGRVMQKLQAESLADLVKMATSLGYSTRTDR